MFVAVPGFFSSVAGAVRLGKRNNLTTVQMLASLLALSLTVAGLLFVLRANDDRLTGRARAAILSRPKPAAAPEAPGPARVAAVSGGFRFDSLRRVCDVFRRRHPDLEVRRTKAPEEELRALYAQGYRRFLAGTSEKHLRRIVPFCLRHPDVLVISPTSTEVSPDLPPNVLRMQPDDSAIPETMCHTMYDMLERAKLRTVQQARQRREAFLDRVAGEEDPGRFARREDERVAGGSLLNDGRAQDLSAPEPDQPGLRTVVILHSDNSYGRALRDLCRTQLKAAAPADPDLEVVGRAVQYTRDTLPQKAELLERMRTEEGLQAVLFVGFSEVNAWADALAAYPQLRALPHVVSSAFDPDLLRSRSGLPGAVFVSYYGQSLQDKFRDFAKELRTVSEAPVEPFAAFQYDALTLLAAHGSHESVRSADFAGVSGEVRFDARGDRVGGVYNLVTVERVLGETQWKTAGLREVTGFKQFSLGDAAHVVNGNKISRAPRPYPLARLISGDGCSGDDPVTAVSRDVYGNMLQWSGTVDASGSVDLHPSDETYMRVECSTQPPFDLQVFRTVSDRDAATAYKVPHHADGPDMIQRRVV